MKIKKLVCEAGADARGNTFTRHSHKWAALHRKEPQPRPVKTLPSHDYRPSEIISPALSHCDGLGACSHEPKQTKAQFKPTQNKLNCRTD